MTTDPSFNELLKNNPPNTVHAALRDSMRESNAKALLRSKLGVKKATVLAFSDTEIVVQVGHKWLGRVLSVSDEGDMFLLSVEPDENGRGSSVVKTQVKDLQNVAVVISSKMGLRLSGGFSPARFEADSNRNVLADAGYNVVQMPDLWEPLTRGISFPKP